MEAKVAKNQARSPFPLRGEILVAATGSKDTLTGFVRAVIGDAERSGYQERIFGKGAISKVTWYLRNHPREFVDMLLSGSDLESVDNDVRKVFASYLLRNPKSSSRLLLEEALSMPRGDPIFLRNLAKIMIYRAQQALKISEARLRRESLDEFQIQRRGDESHILADDAFITWVEEGHPLLNGSTYYNKRSDAPEPKATLITESKIIELRQEGPGGSAPIS